MRFIMKFSAIFIVLTMPQYVDGKERAPIIHTARRIQNSKLITRSANLTDTYDLLRTDETARTDIGKYLPSVVCSNIFFKMTQAKIIYVKLNCR